MSSEFRISRRKILQLLANAPMFPAVAALGSTSFLAGCGGGSSEAATPVSSPKSVTFTSMAAPATVVEQAAAYTAASAVVTYSDGTAITKPLSYQALYKTGDTLKTPAGSNILAGGYFDANGNPIMDTSGSTSEQFYSDCPDGTSLLKLDNPTVTGITGNAVFAVTQFEYKNVNNAGTSMYGLLPSPICIVTADQNKSTGALSPKYYYNIPTSEVHGLWITCAGSLSPWNTHLSSEEYEPDAWVIDNNTAGSGLTQFQTFSNYTFGSKTAAKPYWYGHVPEVTVKPDGTGTIKKHYCMGRISRELVEVLPDNKTVLMGDDATSGGIFMFIADVAKDLSAGTLYVAKLVQTSDANGGAFTLSWIKLGKATSAEIEVLAGSLKATDIMTVKTTDPLDATFTKINYANGQQWVKIMPGMEKAAAFLETHRYAAIMGGTMEFTKFEGVAINIKDKKAYFATSSIQDTMTANGFVSDVIKVAQNKAGATYEVILGADSVIGSDWVPKSMSVPTSLYGEMLATNDSNGNTAVVSKVANPDNLKFSESMRTLFIGEDSGTHLNNFVWAYNVDTKVLSRILSVPAGGECVCLQAVDNLNGFAYLMSGFQHPGDWAFTASQAPLNDAIKAAWGDKKKAAIGYISGMPAI
jgi:uncharacterized protein